jgi:hypothetical protein
MKKLLVVIIFIAYNSSYAQNTKLKANNVKAKYENVFYRSPQKYNNKQQKINITKISYSSSYKGSTAINIYQISIYGKINNKNEQIIYNAKSFEELEYYKNIFNGRYKKITLVVNGYLIGSKKYYDSTISVDY